MSPELFGMGLASLLIVPVFAGFALEELREIRRQRTLRAARPEPAPAPPVATTDATAHA
jgi:hypothetical protein